MPKCSKIAAMMAQRIRQGDYRLRRFPSVNQLAKDLRTNPRTVTKAVDELVQQGVLSRGPTGRVAIHSDMSSKTAQVAFLEPAFTVGMYGRIHQILQGRAAARGWRLKPVAYTHWNDPVIGEVLAGFDGVFFMPMAEDVPVDVLALIKAAPNPVVVMDQDVSSEAIPCLRFHNADAIPALLDPLAARHRSIVCLNTQPTDSVIRERIDQWKLWLKVHRIEGRLIDEHEPASDPAMARARTVLGRYLAADDLPETAVFCTTGAAAVGAMRALVDHGRQPGRDVAICAADDDGGRAPFTCPSLTCVVPPDLAPYLDVCLDWFASGGGEWIGPYLIRPPQTPLFIGESTSLFHSDRS